METGDIKHLATLARIRITEDEAELLKTEIDSVLEYVSVVSEIAANGDLTKKVGARHNIFREDTVSNEPGLYTEVLMSEAPARAGDLLKVKKILNQDES